MDCRGIHAPGEAAVVLAFVPADDGPDSRVAAVDAATVKASAPNLVALQGRSDAERKPVTSSTSASALLDARAGAVLSAEAGNVVPDGAASVMAPAP